MDSARQLTVLAFILGIKAVYLIPFIFRNFDPFAVVRRAHLAFTIFIISQHYILTSFLVQQRFRYILKSLMQVI